MRQLDIFGGGDDLPKTPTQILKDRNKPNNQSPVIVAYGGGKNSTALLILCQKLNIHIDLILFADTGSEKPETYDYIKLFNNWLVSNNMPSITMVMREPSLASPTRKSLIYAKHNLLFGIKTKSKALPYMIWFYSVSSASYSTLEEQCLVTQGLPSKAYGRSSCSIKWKIEPQDDYIAKWDLALKSWEKGVLVRKMIGYHAGELQRLIDKKTNQIKRLEDSKYRYEYPLIEYGLDNFACIQLIQSAGLPIPPKSSCFFCPSASASEVMSLDPELKARGCLIEQVAENGVHHRETGSIKGLGRRFRWQSIDELTDLEKASIDFDREIRSCHCLD